MPTYATYASELRCCCAAYAGADAGAATDVPTADAANGAGGAAARAGPSQPLGRTGKKFFFLYIFFFHVLLVYQLPQAVQATHVPQ